MTFAEILEQLHDDKHTGKVTINLTQGVPVSVEFPRQPETITVERRTHVERRDGVTLLWQCR